MSGVLELVPGLAPVSDSAPRLAAVVTPALAPLAKPQTEAAAAAPPEAVAEQEAGDEEEADSERGSD